MAEKILVVSKHDLPMELLLKGKNGKSKSYILTPANAKKFGAFLQAKPDAIC